MAIYTTFFVADPSQLPTAFPGWKQPLSEPVERELVDFFGEKQIIQTREPLWEDVNPEELPSPEYGVVAIEGDYAAYLEQRIPKFVQDVPHWCAKGLTEVQINPLGEIVDGQSVLEDALFGHPAVNAHLNVFRDTVVQTINEDTNSVAQQWAQRMSTPEFTHSEDGTNRLQDDWTVEDAIAILAELVRITQQRQRGHRLYLLTEW